MIKYNQMTLCKICYKNVRRKSNALTDLSDVMQKVSIMKFMNFIMKLDTLRIYVLIFE